MKIKIWDWGTLSLFKEKDIFSFSKLLLFWRGPLHLYKSGFGSLYWL